MFFNKSLIKTASLSHNLGVLNFYMIWLKGAKIFTRFKGRGAKIVLALNTLDSRVKGIWTLFIIIVVKKSTMVFQLDSFSVITQKYVTLVF